MLHVVPLPTVGFVSTATSRSVRIFLRGIPFFRGKVGIQEVSWVEVRAW